MAVTIIFRLFKFLQMPFSLEEAAQSFQHLIDEVLCGLTCIFTYIDNVLIVSKNKEIHTKHVEEVLYGEL